MKKYKIKRGFISQKMGDKMTIFDGEESILYTFNKSAMLIFENLKKGLDEAKIADLLVQKYSIAKAKAQKDVSELIKDMKRKKIIS